MISDGCLAHKTAVALAALSQYLRFLVSSTSSADRHLLNVNYLVEPYRLPQTATLTTQSLRVDPLPAHVGSSGNRDDNKQIFARGKDFENPVDAKDSGNPDGAEDGEIDIAEERKPAANEKNVARDEDWEHRQLVRGIESQLIARDKEERNSPSEMKKTVRGEAERNAGLPLARGGESLGQQDAGEYDENTEVELDKDDFKLAGFRDFQQEDDEDRRWNVVATDAGGALIAAAAAAVNKRTSHSGGGGGGGSTGSVHVLVKSHWFLSTVAVFLLLFWFRCMRCFRCGYLMRRWCPWTS